MKVLLVLVAVLASLAVTTSADCVCAKQAVVVRSGIRFISRRLGIVYPGHCLELRSTSRQRYWGYYWRNVYYRGQSAWVAESASWVTDDDSCARDSTSKESRSRSQESSFRDRSSVEFPASRDRSSVESPASQDRSSVESSEGCPNIVSRAAWGARRSPFSRAHRRYYTPRMVIIHHSATESCHSIRECRTRMKEIQDYHIKSLGWSDIGYNFVVGEDGNVYEGRGWDTVGAHTRGYNSQTIGICIAGNFTFKKPSNAALNAVQDLIECGVRNGHIRSNYALKGHRDVGFRSTNCPGNRLYDVIKTWPRYG